MEQINDQVKISVIMPVYNMEKYLREAIYSFLSQSQDSIELICVDDCSTDKSLEIISEIAKTNNCIRVCSMPINGGVGKARRKAMTLAQGDYIAFLDSDDLYMGRDVLKTLYDAAKEGDCDVCGGFVLNFCDKEKHPYPRFRQMFYGNSKSYMDIQYKDFQDDYFFQGFIYRREYIEKKRIEFPEWRNYEDPVFLVKALYFAKKIRVVGVEYYAHRYAHKDLNYSQEEMGNILEGIKNNLIFAEEHNLEMLFERTFNRVNKDFFKGIIRNLDKHDSVIENNLMFIRDIGKRHGFSLDIQDYLIFLGGRYDGIEEYKVHKKCSKLANGRIERVVLYGAGNIGTKVKVELAAESGIEIVLWVDSNKAGEMIEGTIVQNPDAIKTSKAYDAVLIGIGNTKVSEKVSLFLEEMGVDCEKIIEWVKL